MFEWECPHCRKKFYSSYPERDQEEICCCYCEEMMTNPYHDPTEKTDD